MSVKITPNLKMRNNSEFNTDLQSALDKIDVFAGSVLGLEDNDNITLASTENIQLIPKKNTASGGSITLGQLGNTSSQTVIYGASLSIGTASSGDGSVGSLTWDGVEVVNLDKVQTLTNKTIDGLTNTITNVSLTTGVKDILPIANGGTNSSTANGALNNLLPNQSGNSGKSLTTGGSSTSWVLMTTMVDFLAHVGATNVHGVAEVVGTSEVQTITNKDIDGSNNTVTNVSLTTAVSDILPITSGGTGETSASAAINALVPGQSGKSGQVLTSNGTSVSWVGVSTSNLMSENNIDVGDASLNRTQVDTSSVGDIEVGASTGAVIKAEAIDNANISSTAGVEVSKLEALTADKVAQIGSTGFLEASAVSNVELSYVAGVTSSIQTQINAKEPTLPLTTRGDVLLRGASNTTDRLPIGAASQVLTSDGTDVSWQNASTTLQDSYDNSASPPTIQTDSSQGNLVVSGTESVDITTDGGLNITGGTLGTIGATGVPNIKLNGEISGAVDLYVPSTITTYPVTLPGVQGSVDDVLSNDGSGNLSWVNIPGGVQTALDGKLDSFSGATATAVMKSLGGAGGIEESQVLIDAGGNISGMSDITLAGHIDRSTVAALNIGATNATTLSLGRTGQTTVVKGNLQVDGTTTTVNSATLDVTDANVTVNKGGNQASADKISALTVEMSDATDATIIYDKDIASKWKLGELGSETEIVTVSTTQTLTNKTLTSPAITTPTGLVKGDVGLGNVDNTSDITKDAATATLTNKTITKIANSLSRVITTYLSAQTLSASVDDIVLVSGTTLITLPDASANSGVEFIIKKLDSNATSVTIGISGGDSIDGSSTYSLNEQYVSVSVVSDGTTWHII